jgi:hypothetical protein
MTDDQRNNDPNALQNAETAKVTAHQRETDMRQQTAKIREALQG